MLNDNQAVKGSNPKRPLRRLGTHGIRDHILIEVISIHPGINHDPLAIDSARGGAQQEECRIGDFLSGEVLFP
jgi:hypothetical protein